MIFLKRPNINDALQEYRGKENALLLDVREEDEFRAGFIPGAVNVPLSKIDAITLPKDKALYVYCLRGRRSRQATRALRALGYTDVRSIGGILSYQGPLEKP